MLDKITADIDDIVLLCEPGELWNCHFRSFHTFRLFVYVFFSRLHITLHAFYLIVKMQVSVKLPNYRNSKRTPSDSMEKSFIAAQQIEETKFYWMKINPSTEQEEDVANLVVTTKEAACSTLIWMKTDNEHNNNNEKLIECSCGNFCKRHQIIRYQTGNNDCL